jgi:adenosylcobinamide kinase/adenosylcobinamide-phosphate guanylyltransferase
MRILLTGGSACGKSTFAERLALAEPEPRVYLAAMRPLGEAARGRIARHRARRGADFVTVERYADLAGADFPGGGVIVLECVCNLTANEMFGADGSVREAFDAVMGGVVSLEARCDTLLVVTNDVGSGLGEYGAGTRRYIETLGRVNVALAARFDRVYELVCGIPILLKGETK